MATSAASRSTVDQSNDIQSLLVQAQREPSRHQAIHLYRKVTKMDPHHCKAWHNMGTAYMAIRDFHEARSALETAIKCRPDYVLAYANLAATLVELHLLVEAKQAGEKALQLPEPRHPHLYSTLGSVCLSLGDTACAIQYHEEAIRRDPDNVDIATTLANTYEWLHRYRDARRMYIKALTSRKDPVTWVKYVHNNMQLCIWTTYPQDMVQLRELVQTQLDQSPTAPVSLSPWPVNYLPFGPAEAKAIAQRHFLHSGLPSRTQRKQDFPFWSLDISNIRPEEGKLRIGYIGYEFDGDGPIGHLIWRMFQHHENVQVHIFALGGTNSPPQRTFIEQSVTRVHDVSQKPYDIIAGMIEQKRLHVLIDIAGWLRPDAYRVMSLRPAPIIVSLPASPMTSGTDFIDYFTADSTIIPAHLAQVQFTEKMMYFPRDYHYMSTSYPVHRYCSNVTSADTVNNDAPAPSTTTTTTTTTPIPTRAQYGLPEGKLVLASFSTLYKVDPIVFDVWTDILTQVPDSVLWMQRGPAEAVPSLLQAWKRTGLASDRLIFSDRVPHDEHLRRLPLADLILDTTAFTSHGTGMDYYWAGVPMVTLQRAKLTTRLAAAITYSMGPRVRALGTVAGTISQYREIALRLAQDHQALQRARRVLAEARCVAPLFQTRRWTQHWQHGLQMMWELHSLGVSPMHIVLS